MHARFNFVARWFSRRYFGGLRFDDDTVARLRELEAKGTVLYAMRYASRLDYFLLNALLLRHDLRLSDFSNGIRFDYYASLWRSLRLRYATWRSGDLFRRNVDRVDLVDLFETPRSLFVFLRTERLRAWLRGRRHVASLRRSDREILDCALEEVLGRRGCVTVVPVALFWRKGPRNARRFLNLAYGSPTRPSDFAKVTSFLLNYRSMSVKVGEGIDLAEFAAPRPDDRRDALVRKLRRRVLVPLSREEKVVEGPSLRPRHKVAERVLAARRVEAAIQTRAGEGSSVEAARASAASMFGEIAASMNSTFLAILAATVGGLFRRLFVGIETTGLDRVAEVAPRYPIVLVPNHRSYFDFLLLSWLFYAHYMVPPHIAARENMAFGPMGFIFRRAGAFFLRRSFDDALYKEVFRSYVSYLVREGFPQEFFIEGGRSRTGRTLAPKLGMLTWNVEAFLDSGRRDLLFVPVGITYERLVEEGAMLSELAGGGKERESLLGLFRARKVLGRRWGSAFVRFGEPISLAEALGEKRERFAIATGDEVDSEKRVFVGALGNRLVERINEASVVNATSVAAAVFLASGRRGLLQSELARGMNDLMTLLRLQGATFTPALSGDAPEFRDAIAFLLRSELVRRAEDPRGDILFFEAGKRQALDLYRNGIVHFLAPASFVARKVLEGSSSADLVRDLEFWLDLLYCEFFVPKDIASGERVGAILRHFETSGWGEQSAGTWRATEKGRIHLQALARQTKGLLEAYDAALRAASAIESQRSEKQLIRDAEQAFAHSDLLGQIESPEVASRATFGNAFDALARRRVLERVRGDKARDLAYRRGVEWKTLAPISVRLAGGIGDR